MTHYTINNRLVYLSGGIETSAGMWPSTGSDWWDPGGSFTCIAAYQAKGAASQSASYVNLANPGTHDAGVGVAPSWAAGTGWTFNGSTQYLTTSFLLAEGTTVAVRVANSLLSENYHCVTEAHNPGYAAAVWPVYPTEGGHTGPQMTTCNADAYYAGGSLSAVENGVIVAAGETNVYVDNVARTLYLSSSQSYCTTRSPYIGCSNRGGSPLFYYDGDVIAIAWYSNTLDATQVGTLTTNMQGL